LKKERQRNFTWVWWRANQPGTIDAAAAATL
jgi:hypothetical protein